ncbi:unnamed protein product [Allacma fusca]|uniref:Uncharacterized protein n=1 Tax=Allacma fusca TaxID=39272 RepID=A0A8J2PGF6_9HEXA|nr:unnamed protein product [Allacma fusca]
MLKNIDDILRRVDPAHAGKPFAGRSVILFGDVYLNFAVADSSLFYPSSSNHNPHLRDVTKLYKSFKTVIILDTQYSHHGDSDEQNCFLECLGRLKRRECVQSDLEFVRSRQLSKLGEEEKQTFRDALHIFPLRRLVWDYNQ